MNKKEAKRIEIKKAAEKLEIKEFYINKIR